MTVLKVVQSPTTNPVVSRLDGSKAWPCDSMSEYIGLMHWIIFPANVRRMIR